MTSLYDTVVTRWRAAFPARVVDQFLAEEGTRVQEALADAERVVRERRSQHNFQQWLDAQAVAGRDFDEGQLRWLDWMREDITAHGGLSEDFSRGRCAEAGGAERARRVFGRRTLSELVASLNTTLGPPATACGCGGRCGACKPPSPEGRGVSRQASASVSQARLAELTRGASPETADDFAAFDVLVDAGRRADSERDDVILTRLMAKVDAQIDRGESERFVVATIGRDYIEGRAEAILLRGAGLDAVPLLLDRTAIAISVAPFGPVVAVRDANGRLMIHPERGGTLNHLFADVRRAEQAIGELHEAIDLPVALRKHLPRFATALWAQARERAARLTIAARQSDPELRAAYYARRFEDDLGYPMPPAFAEIVLRHLTSLHNELAPLEGTLDDRNILPRLVSLAGELVRNDYERPWRTPEDPERARMRVAVDRLVKTLPRPELATLRSWTTHQHVTPGSLVVMPLDPEAAENFPPEERYALALHLPNGRGFMFSFGQLADPGPEDLRDFDRQWEWDDDPHEVRGVPADTDMVVLARDLDWADLGAILGFRVEPISEHEGRGLSGDWED